MSQERELPAQYTELPIEATTALSLCANGEGIPHKTYMVAKAYILKVMNQVQAAERKYHNP